MTCSKPDELSFVRCRGGRIERFFVDQHVAHDHSKLAGDRAFNIDPPASSYAIMRSARPCCGENSGPASENKRPDRARKSHRSFLVWPPALTPGGTPVRTGAPAKRIFHYYQRNCRPSPSWSGCRRPFADDVDDVERHHDLAGLIDDLDERGDRAAIGFGFRGCGFQYGHAHR